ncbi:MAG: hypothetical protein V4534_02965 [Myxococcota bacterium]
MAPFVGALKWLTRNFTAPVFLGFLTVIVTLVRLEVRDQSRAFEIDLSSKNAVHDEIAIAITNIRLTRLLIREKCKFFPKESEERVELYNANIRRIEAVASLIRAGFKAQSTFGDEVGQKVKRLILQFDTWDLKFENVCIQVASFDNEYMAKETEILAPMKAAIADDKMRLKSPIWLPF